MFDAYYSGLSNYASKLFGDRDLGEEHVQDVFCSLWEKRENLNINSNPKGYLIMAVRNRFINYSKREKTAAEVHLEIGQRESIGDHGLPVFDLKDKIVEAYESLPEQCRKVFQMSREEGLKYPEIAQKLGISVKTVENHMGKGLRIFKTQLKEYLPVLFVSLIDWLC